MNEPSSMKQVWAYLRDRPDAHVTAEELASVSGYSFFHFCHLFTSLTGKSVAAYLRVRSLELAAADLLRGEPVAEISRKRGFDTSSGFSKAFRRQYGITPTEYRATRGLAALRPTFKKMDAFCAVGYNLAPPQGEFDVLDTGAYWAGNRFSSVTAGEYARLNAAHLGEIGCWMRPDRVTGEFYYFFGPIVRDFSYLPRLMEPLTVPAAQYAVFRVPRASSLTALKENVRRVWKYIFLDWLDRSGYELDERKIDFEYYLNGESFIYLPVTAAEPRK